ncbi:chlorophyllide reductase iron protein subunit X, partial [Pseudomonas sp. GW101-1A09]
MSMLDQGVLRDEAHEEPDPVHSGPVTKETQIIA